jgi:uncharacterized membrane protein
MRKTTIATLILLIVSFIIAVYLYPRMPTEMASHWNGYGEVDGYIPKFWGLFLMPIISLAMFLLLIFIPKIDPLKKNVDKFRGYYEWFILLMVGFLFYLYVLTLIWNFGHEFNMILALMPVFALLFYYSGMLMQHSKRNWFIGIKTPWTLSSDIVWDKTHKLGAKLFKITGILCLLGMLLPRYAIWLVLVPVLLSAIVSIVYSYVVFKKQIKKR